MNYPIVPYVGSGKSGSSSKVEDDNLFSRDYLEAVLGFGEGVYHGLVDGVASIEINGEKVVITNEVDDEETYSISDAYLSWRLGYEDDDPIKYFLKGETSVVSSDNKELIFGNSESYLTSQSLRGKINYLQLRLIVQALFSGDSKGNVNNNSVALLIRYKPATGTEDDWRYVTKNSVDLLRQSTLLDTAKNHVASLGLTWENLTNKEKEYYTKASEEIVSEITYTEETSIGTPVVTSNGRGGFTYNYKVVTTTRLNQLQNSADNTDYDTSALYFITGKTTSGYIHEITLPVPILENDDWQIQIMKCTKEYNADEAYSKRTIGIQQITAILATQRQYPRTVLAHLVAPYTDQFSTVGDVRAEFYCKLIEVPTNYNSFAHTYDESNLWLNTYKSAWSDNPVWILREVIMNIDWGMRRYESSLKVDDASFYTWAKYCDEQLIHISDSTKKVQRHSFNDEITELRDLKSFLTYICSCFRGSLTERNGVYYLTVDTYKEPKFFLTPDMITDVGYTYSKTELSTRWNRVKVEFQNEALDYEDDTRYVSNNKSILTYGVIEGSVQPIGCTDLTQAIRAAAYALLTNSTETILMSCSIPRLGLYLETYDTLYVVDPDIGWGYSARIKSKNGLVLTFKDKLKGDVGTVFNFLYHSPSKVNKITATKVNDYQLMVSEDSGYLYEDIPVVYYTDVNPPKTFRLVSLADNGTGDGLLYTLQTAIINQDKYDIVDNLTNTTELLDFSVETYETIFNRIYPPTNLKVKLTDFAVKSGFPKYQVEFTPSETAKKYLARWSMSEGLGTEYEQYIYSSGDTVSPAFANDGSPINFELFSVASDGRLSRSTALIRYSPPLVYGEGTIAGVDVTDYGFFVRDNRLYFQVIWSSIKSYAETYITILSNLVLSKDNTVFNSQQDNGLDAKDWSLIENQTNIFSIDDASNINFYKDALYTFKISSKLGLKDPVGYYDEWLTSAVGSYGMVKTKVSAPTFISGSMSKLSSYKNSKGEVINTTTGNSTLKFKLKVNPLNYIISDSSIKYGIKIFGTKADGFKGEIPFIISSAMDTLGNFEITMQGDDAYVATTGTLEIKHDNDTYVGFESDTLILSY